MHNDYHSVNKGDILSVWFTTPEGGGETLFCKVTNMSYNDGIHTLFLDFALNPSPSMKIWHNNEMVYFLDVLKEQFGSNAITIQREEFSDRVSQVYTHDDWVAYLKRKYNITVTPDKWYTSFLKKWDEGITEIGKYLRTSQHW